MKIAEIREIATNELAERIEAEVANYNHGFKSFYLSAG